ncbi:MAG: HAD family hydrolase [Candidatus Paceibacterota bacterium]|jgi:FMN phosphatase YigB (HAD superfamily)
MIDYKTKIKVIGFDLDQTLYPKMPEVDEKIQQYIYQKIACHKNVSLPEAKKLFTDIYLGGKGLSGSKTLLALEVPNGKEIVQEALERADIASVLTPEDEKVLVFLNNLKSRYAGLDLITGSDRSNAEKKLSALKIPEELFNHIITGDDVSKSDGSAYSLWLSYYNFPVEQFLYIGDRIMSDYEVPKKLGIKSILVNITEKDVGVDCPQLPFLLDLENFL